MPFALVLDAQTLWTAVGPDGGDARSFAAVPGEPQHLFLGSTTGWVFESLDGGGSWRRLSKLDGDEDKLVVDHIVVDPADQQLVYAAAWTLNRTGGGLWVSRDGARSWSELAGMHGQSIRALALAPSDSKIIYAGTLQGVFRSSDGGVKWSLISPPGSTEIHEIESLAVDPADPAIVYAGTWHLPWKTDDGGAHWHNIKQGIIDDSDVFSVIVDPVHRHTVYLSACSGIYKSDNSGVKFRKIEGIPATARRTRVLKQDPVNRDVVYAGTTEGLYKSVNAGKSFRRMTGPDVIVNDIFIDPQNPSHVLLATDRSGVLLSSDAGVTFVASNRGFSARTLAALLVDRAHPERIFAGVVNDKQYGGVFLSTDGGRNWSQLGDGLNGSDIFALGQAADGTVLAGTNHGIFALKEEKDDPAWRPENIIANTLIKTVTTVRRGTRVHTEKSVSDPLRHLDGRVNALDLSGEVWAAATDSGVYTSHDRGATWQGGPVMGWREFASIAVHGSTVVAVRAEGGIISRNGGASWEPAIFPQGLTQIRRVVFSPDGVLWLGGFEGIFFSTDQGRKWFWAKRIPLRYVDDITYDPSSKRLLASSRSGDQIFAIDPETFAWKSWNTGYRINLVGAAGGHPIAASLYSGMIVEPEAGRR